MMLTRDQAIAIYRVRLQNEDSTFGRTRAAEVARIYRVNEKTVRDIWSGRTWRKDTESLDTPTANDETNFTDPNATATSEIPRIHTITPPLRPAIFAVEPAVLSHRLRSVTVREGSG
jgi:hypothetical protein